MIKLVFEKKKGPSFLEVAKKIPVAERKLVGGMKNVALLLRDYVRQIIVSSIKREGSTGSLIRSIEVDGPFFEGDKKVWFGVGQKSKMPVYWAIVNWGGKVGGGGRIAVPGYFGSGPPGTKPGASAMNNQKFTKDSAGPYMMYVHNPIRPMHYVERGYGWLHQFFAEEMKRKMEQEKEV